MKFKLSAQKRPSALERRKKDPCAVVTDGIDTQIAMIKAQEKGEEYTVARQRYVTIIEDGQERRVKKTVQCKPKQWFWQQGGIYFTEIRYGSSHVVELQAGMPSIECGKTIKDVARTLDEVKKAALAGELHNQIESARQKASRKK